MNPSRRIRIFGLGFFGGCLLAAGIAWLRVADDPPPPPSLPTWTTLTGNTPPPPNGAPPGDFRIVKTWRSPAGGFRWLVQDEEEVLWRIGDTPDATETVRADRIHVFGAVGIEVEALRAGLRHNGFEPLEFYLPEIRFLVAVDPFEPDSIEQAVRLLESRKPYITEVRPIHFPGDPN